MRGSIVAAILAIFVFLAAPGISDAQPGDVSFTGFVDVAFYNNTNSEESTFSLDQAEIDIQKAIEDAGGLRIDIQHVRGAESTTDNVIEQGYVWVAFPAGAVLTFGKFNAPIGFELLDPNDMYQYSHAYVFDFGLPTNLTGVMLSATMGMIDVSIYVVNGWDLISDDNKDKTAGGRIGITPSEGVNLGVSYITGPEGSDADGAQPATLSVLDVDMTITAVKNLTLGAEFNSGMLEGMSLTNSGDDAKWTGWLIMANYAFTEKGAVTLRYDQFHDKDGARFGNGVNETRTALTLSPSYVIADGFGVLAEYKYEKSDKNTFADNDGNSKDNETSFAVELTHSF